MSSALQAPSAEQPPLEAEVSAPPAVWELSNDDIISLFQIAANRISAVSLTIGYPAECAVPHMLVNSFKNLAAVAVATEIDFKQAEEIKDITTSSAKSASWAESQVLFVWGVAFDKHLPFEWLLFIISVNHQSV